MNVADPQRTRIADAEYLRRYEQEVQAQVRVYRMRQQVGGGGLRCGHLADTKGDGARIAHWEVYVARLKERGLWRGGWWAMNPDGSWRRWSHLRLLNDG